jgi:hypothetical protein
MKCKVCNDQIYNLAAKPYCGILCAVEHSKQLERVAEVLAGHDNLCPYTDAWECTRKTDTPSDKHETCVACRIKWAHHIVNANKEGE